MLVLEVPKTDKSFEERLIFKTFILKFVNAFSPIIYIAFFRGRSVARSPQLLLLKLPPSERLMFPLVSLQLRGPTRQLPVRVRVLQDGRGTDARVKHSNVDVDQERSENIGRDRLAEAVQLLGVLLPRVPSLCQCAYGGCLMELCIQLSITMLGKQLIQNNLFEIGIP